MLFSTMYAPILARGLVSRTLRALPTPNLAYRSLRSLVTVPTVVNAAPAPQKPEISTPVHRNSLQLDAFVAAHFPVLPQNLLPFFGSCDWARWGSLRFFCVRDGWHNLSEAEFIFKHCFKLQGGLRPLAYRDLGVDPQVIVAVGTQYVVWDGMNEVLTHFPGRYSSDEDFLRRVMRHGNFRKDMGRERGMPLWSDKIWRKINKEQRALLRHFGPHNPSLPNFV
ncbi:hypothetical protein C8R47DRAFT_1141559 [Mycena vitilis]|nr:hypothetical protein C8R47DRAFT_1141559 [Mycena vitilis]